MSIFTLEKLYKAYNECKKGKKNTHNALDFEIRREDNLVELLNDLKSREYKISRYIYFIATYPTAREIFAADFRDRVVHHLLYEELYLLFDEDFISNSFANRIGKGTHKAVGELKKNIKKAGKKSGNGWYLKLDVQGFFRSINKDILYEIIYKKVISEKGENFFTEDEKEEILWLVKIIIFNNPTRNYIYRGDISLKKLIPKSKSLFYSGSLGLPIGNLTSQFFANIYLNELDHFVVEKLGFDKYLRYVDDFILISDHKDELKSIISLIDTFLVEHLELKLHPRKIILQPTRHGVDFLGYYIKPTHTLVRRKVVKRFKNKLREKRDPNDGLFRIADIPMIMSYLGHFGHANSFNLIKKLIKQ